MQKYIQLFCFIVLKTVGQCFLRELGKAEQMTH